VVVPGGDDGTADENLTVVGDRDLDSGKRSTDLPSRKAERVLAVTVAEVSVMP
jgi:hypothetical protein